MSNTDFERSEYPELLQLLHDQLTESDDKLDANIPAGHLLVLFSSSAAIVVGTYNLLGIEPLTRAAAESLLY